MTDQPAVPAKQREPQVAVAPLNTIAVEDVGRGAAKVDAWLQSTSGGVVTLDRIKNVAGALPVVGNIMALVDALGDIITLAESEEPDLLDWVSLGINLIGVLPLPPTMAAARMTLRPTLFLVRQELRNSSKLLLGDALIEVLVGHLNATIVGTLDDFIAQAQPKLVAVLDDAGQLGEQVITELAKGLEAVVNGQLDAKGDLSAAGSQLSLAGDQLLHDPKAAIGNIFDASLSAYKAVGKGMANTAAKSLLPEEAKQRVQTKTAELTALCPELRNQISRLSDPRAVHSIGWLLQMLAGAVAIWRKRQALGQSANVKSNTTSKAHHLAGKGRLEVVNSQAAAKGTPNTAKNGVCPATCHSISFAMGSETLSHSDFSLPGPFAIEWERTYCSSLGAYDHGLMGARWINAFTTRFERVKDGLLFHAADGRSHRYPLPNVGKYHHDAIENLTLVRTADDTLVLCQGYERKETYLFHGQHYRLDGIELRNGAGVMLRYEHRHNDEAILSDLITYQGDITHLHLSTLIDDHGRLLGLWEIHDGKPQRQLCAYHYDADGDLILAQDENGAAWTYQYQHHLITRYTDRTERGMNLQWQGTGADAKAVREWADDGSFDTRLDWDENIRLTYVTDALGHETWHYYDLQGYTYRIRYPDDRSEWLFRDDAKNLIRHVHVDGSTDRYAYDARDNLLQHIRADHSVVHYAYDDHNQLIKISDAEGGLWLRDYDLHGNLTETLDPLGNKTEYAYNKAGLPTAIKDANGAEKTLDYTPAGQLTSYTDCSGKTSTWAYNALGQRVGFTDAAGHTTEYRYQSGHLVLIKHPDNTEEQFRRDAEGRLLTHVDDLGRCTTWSYTAAGLIAERIDAAEQTLRYRWDRLGRLLNLENENQQHTRFEYDPVGRLLTESGFDGRVTRYTYDAESGRLASTVDGQRVINLQFDPMNRLIERRATLGERTQAETFAYDGNGNLLLASNPHSRLQWFHDAAGNLLREHQHYLHSTAPTVSVWQHEYDPLNQRIATTRPDGHRVSWLTYGSGHVLSLKLDDQELVGYERDDLHREVARHHGNHLVQRQSWDPLGRLEQQVLIRSDGKSLLLNRDYSYDNASQLTRINDSRRGPLAYRYDPVGRLLHATSRLGEETFAFDPASNLLDEKTQQPQRPLEQNPNRSKLMDNLLRDYAGTHYEYDERGNQTKRLHNGRVSHLHWDLFDRLTHFSDDRLTVAYTYDALGRRLSKNAEARFQNNPAAGSQWNINQHALKQRELGCDYTLYGWDGDTLAWETCPPLIDGDTGRTVHYVYEPGTFIPVAQALRFATMRLLKQPDYSGAYDPETDPLWTYTPVVPKIDVLSWYHCDHLGTPQEMSDRNGQIVWSADHKAWGEIREQRSEKAKQQGLSNPLRFQGQYHDHETGLHYNRYRYYDPRVGRFISKDPIGYAGGLNLFAYAPNPVGWVDPLGLAKSPASTDRKPKSSKPNQNTKCPCRKKWVVERFDRICEGNLNGTTVKYFRDPKTELWWSTDTEGHGGSAWKIMAQERNELVHRRDADIYGDFMNKHKGDTGKIMPMKNMKCRDAKRTEK